MAITVIYLVQPLVRIIHVIYKVDYVLNVEMEYMADTVTCRVQAIVRTTHVTCSMGHALDVSLDGPKCFVEKVKIHYLISE